MSLTSFLRKSVSSLAPLALRTLRAPRNYHSAIFTALNHSRFQAAGPSLIPFPRAHRFSTKSDESLLRVIESEIQCAEESDDHDRVEETLNDFPFEIEDKPGFQTITLKREYEVR
ncbi:hypothetical protein SAY86_005042 [Trapa natans]|uniref:Uncharacterized protein n=1 Tax=Trapa natans TaxID=22666 RepID=A0AAN7L2R7_TRANT|nr:hypothetical protein SAY86_005042 [Trapa natans]